MDEYNSDLRKWCKRESGNIKKLSEVMKVHISFLSHVIHGRRLLPIDLIPVVSSYTGIKPKDLRPDVWSIMNECS